MWGYLNVKENFGNYDLTTNLIPIVTNLINNSWMNKDCKDLLRLWSRRIVIIHKLLENRNK